VLRRSTDEETKPKELTLSDNARHMLEVLATAPKGVQSEPFALAIGVSGPSKVPVKVMTLKKELLALGIPPREVIITEQFYEKGRKRSLYRPGPRISDALRRTGDLFGGK
jgi:hypothetical protein